MIKHTFKCNVPTVSEAFWLGKALQSKQMAGDSFKFSIHRFGEDGLNLYIRPEFEQEIIALVKGYGYELVEELAGV